MGRMRTASRLGLLTAVVCCALIAGAIAQDQDTLQLTLALLIDTSPSVRPVFEEEKVTAKAFIESIMRSKDLALVIGFDRSVTLVQDYTENVRLLKRAINELE